MIKQFRQKSSEKDDFIIHPSLFEIPKKVVLVEIPYYPKNKAFSKQFIKKFDELADGLYDIRVKWVTKKVKQLFKIKIKNPHPSCVIYEGTSVCTETYLGETRRNAIIRWDGNEDPKKETEQGKHFINHPYHLFFRKFLLPAASNNHVRKIT